MNSILNDLTYCDGRFEKDARATFSDSPSRLKLRSNTFQGIQTSLEKRRTPAKTNDFFIPSAALPQMNVVEEGAQGEGGVNQEKSEITHRNPEEIATEVGYGASKKLKVGSKQFEGLNLSRVKNMPDEAPIQKDEVKENVVVDEKMPESVLPAVNDIKRELPKVELPRAVPVKEEEKKQPEIQPIPVDNVQNEISTPKPKENEVEEKIDEFANLQKVTEKYEQTAQEYDRAKQELSSAEEAFQESKRQLETTEKEIEGRKEEIQNQRNVIDTTKKDIATIEEETEKVRSEIRRRTIAIEKAREKKARETRDVVDKTKQVKENTSQNQLGIEANNKTIESMNKEAQTLASEENQVLSEKAKARSELEKVEEILKAITLPEGAEEYMSEEKENSSIKQENRDNVIDFPNYASDIVNEDELQKSIGAYKAG